MILRGPWAFGEERIVSTVASSTIEQNLHEELIQRMSHEEECIAAISPVEAAETQEELWASGVEMLIARDFAQPSGVEVFLLLTFNRFTRELNRALLASPFASRVANPIPTWANGAKILAALDHDVVLALLPPGHVLRPWNVVIREADEQALFVDISYLPEPERRLKSGVGRLVLHNLDSDSVQANPDADREIPQFEIRNSFVHVSPSNDIRSTRSA
jgi:hypothetical protein